MELMDPVFARASALGRTNAATKIVVATLQTLVFVVSLDWVTSSLGLVLLLAAMTAAGMRPWAVARKLWFIFAAAVLSGWATALMAEKSGRLLLDLGPWQVSTGSLDSGIAIMLRGCALALISVMFLASTDAHELGESLAQTFRLPPASCSPRWRPSVSWVCWPRSGRPWPPPGGPAASAPAPRWSRSPRGFAQQAFALMVQALRRASRLAVTMEARGFGAGPRTWLNPPTYHRVDVVVLILGLLIPVIAVGASLALGSYRTIF
ncbi:hypothetical protein A5N15_05055 [Rothia kristinae]|uniref:Energy-coupling factor transporter transmembrane protein EcfT n=1 Tax=Rothia kristinae TaxID=37923 RepID=A0A657IUZ2_9MICC|nr:hypothetical protein A5N15_05055 [Rothia kristinae]